APRAPELEKLARKRGVQLLYSASVSGALPALETLRRERGAVHSFSGVLNATSNFVLDGIARGLTPRQAFVAVQRAGYAEADTRCGLREDIHHHCRTRAAALLSQSYSREQ